MAEYDWTSEHERLWREFVPTSGQADTVQGELIRCIGKLTDEAYRNGNLNWDDEFEQMCRFVSRTLDDPSVFDEAERAKIRAAVGDVLEYESPDTFGHGSSYYYLAEAAVKWCLSKKGSLPLQPGHDL
jgi:hypothetical protein